jgi:hypothetical protein
VSYCESVAEAAPHTPLFYYHFPGTITGLFVVHASALIVVVA